MLRAIELAVAYGHTRPDGSDPWAAYDVYGINYGARAENIALGQYDDEDAYISWREDNYGYSGQGHRRAMLGQYYTTMGSAHVLYNGVNFYVEEFSSENYGEAATAANNSDYATTVNVLTSRFQGLAITANTQNTIRLEKGAAKEISNVKCYLKVAGSSPSGYVNKYLVDTPVTYTSSDPTVATCDANGKITALKSGTTTITMSAQAYGYSASNEVKVEVYTPITNFYLREKAVNMTKGDTRKLEAVIEPTDADYTAIEWSSSNTSVATVADDGTVTALAKGTVYITATLKYKNGWRTSSCYIRISEAKADPGAGTSEGWYNGDDGKSYWYEGGIRQGTESDPKGVWGDGRNRGREIYDPKSDGWYWLDSVYDGAKACNKEVWIPYIYQNEAGWDAAEIQKNADASGLMSKQVKDAINNKLGKWVRYDAKGKMFKEWYHVVGQQAEIYPDQAGNWYYYDPKTGLMAKGWLKIGGYNYHFDEVTGVCLNINK